MLRMQQKPVTGTEFAKVMRLLGAVFIGLWLLYGVPLENLIYDPSFYYAHIRSPIIDCDLDFSNDGIPAVLVAQHTTTGLVGSFWSAGPSLIWAPFFLLAHGLTHGLNALGFAVPLDGYSPLYLTLCAFGSALCGWIGVIFCYLIARRVAGPHPALLATLALWLTSPLFYYMYKNPMYAHAPTVTLIAATLYLCLCLAERGGAVRYWFLLGLLFGIAALMRWQNGLFIVLAPMILSMHKQQWKQSAYRLGATLFGALLGFAPQMAVWQRLYGKPLAFPQGGDFLLWFRPAIIEVLSSSNRGLFVWQPIALVACIGLLLYIGSHRRVGVGLLLIAAAELYLNSIVRDWWGGGGYGPRRFDWFVPIEVLGVALILQRFWNNRMIRSLSVIICGCLIVYQLALAQAHYYRILPQGQPYGLEQYDHGLPLKVGFFRQVVLGSLREPLFLFNTLPTGWSTATPAISTIFALAAGAKPTLQVYTTLFVAVFAVLLTYLLTKMVTQLWYLYENKATNSSIIKAINIILPSYLFMFVVLFLVI